MMEAFTYCCPDGGATLRGPRYQYRNLMAFLPAMSCYLLMCMLMHFTCVKLLAQWLQVSSADGGATLSGLRYCYQTFPSNHVVFASCCLLMCMLIHFPYVKLLAQWLQVYSADGGATLSRQLDLPALSCPFTQPICEACLHQDYHGLFYNISNPFYLASF